MAKAEKKVPQKKKGSPAKTVQKPQKGMQMRFTLLVKLVIPIAGVMSIVLTIGAMIAVQVSKNTLIDQGKREMKLQQMRSSSSIKEAEDLLEARIKQDSHAITIFMQVPLWNVDQELATSAVESIIPNKDIIGILVTDSGGLTFVGKRKSNGRIVPFNNISEVSADLFRSESNVMRGDEVIGKTTVVYTKDRIDRLRKRSKEDSALFQENLAAAIAQQTRQIILNRVIEAIMSFLVILLTVTWVARKIITKPLKDLTSILDELASAKGDLTRRLEATGNDEIKDLSVFFNKFVGQIQAIVKNIAQGAGRIDKDGGELSTSVDNISNTIHELTSLATTQSAAIEQTSASMREIQSGVEMTANYAQDADQLSSQADEASQKGSQAVKEMQLSMQRIQDTATQINNFISAINEIANQTNLLSLNAAIEAAKAGEQGKGFAVVADEVRRLAENSAKVTQEIQGLIKESNQRINDGQEAVKSVEASLTRISEKISDSSSVVSQISTATSEQNVALQEINVTLEKLAESSTEVAEASQKIDTSANQQVKFAHNTSENAHDLLEQIKQFKY